MELKVKLESFEGPLDLLLYLIQQNEMDIVNIKINDITKQYLAVIDTMKELNIDIASDFLLMAATLVQIKSRSILPKQEDPLADVEELQTKEDLIKQLLEYRKYKEAASQLRQLPLLGDVVFKRPIVEEDFGPDEKLKLKEVSVTDLTLAFQDILKRSKHAVTIVRKDFISVSDRIQQLADVLTVGSQHDFDSFFSEDSTKIEVVITFISILELAKHGRVRVMQDVVYGTIVILTIASLKEIDYTKIDDFGGASAKEKADKEIKADEDIKNQETLL